MSSRPCSYAYSETAAIGERSTADEDRFIYDFGWPDEVGFSKVHAARFDDTLHRRPGVGDWFVRLAPLLRPAVRTKQSQMVSPDCRSQTHNNRTEPPPPRGERGSAYRRIGSRVAAVRVDHVLYGCTSVGSSSVARSWGGFPALRIVPATAASALGHIDADAISAFDMTPLVRSETVVQ